MQMCIAVVPVTATRCIAACQQHIPCVHDSLLLAATALCVLAGKLHVEVRPSKDDVEGSQSLSSSFRSWLRSSAKLLHSLTVLGPKRAEADVVSGLTATAAAEMGAAAEATAALPAADARQLQLQSLACYSTCKGSIFSGLACASQLTRLTLCMYLPDALYCTLPASCGDALGALTSLRALTLRVHRLPQYNDYPTCRCHGNFDAFGTALQSLTLLTGLDFDPDPDSMHCATSMLQGFRFAACLEACGCMEALPASLKDLPLSCWLHQEYQISFEHLTALSVLQLRGLRKGIILPAGLRVLRLPDCMEFEPLVPDRLQLLEELHMHILTSCTHPSDIWNALKGLRGCPQFRELHLGILQGEDRPSDLLQGLADMPVVELSVDAEFGSLPGEVVSALTLLTQLTSLSLTSNRWRVPVVKQLAAALQRQTALQELRIKDSLYSDMRRGVFAGCADWELVCQALVGTRGLRSVHIGSCQLGDAAPRLAAATQLTCLELHGCGLSDASTAALAESLQCLVL